MELKVLFDCPCGCGEKVYEVEVYKGFQITQRPYGDGNLTLVAEKIHKTKLDALMLASSPFSDYGMLRDDNAHQNKEANNLDTILSSLKETIDKFEETRKDVLLDEMILIGRCLGLE